MAGGVLVRSWPVRAARPPRPAGGRRALAHLLHAAVRERHGGLRARVIEPRPARRDRRRGGSLRMGVARDELPERRLEGRRVDELPVLHDGAPERRRPCRAPVGNRSSRSQRQGLHRDLLELRRHVLRVVRRRLHHPRADDVEQRLAAEPAVERPAREDLPEDDAERVEIAPSIDRLPAGLLGGHVPELALEDALLFREEARARDPGSRRFFTARLSKDGEDVLRADVAVDDLERFARPRPSSRARKVEALCPPRTRSTAPSHTAGCSYPSPGAPRPSGGRGRTPRRTPWRGAGRRRRSPGTRTPVRRSGD